MRTKAQRQEAFMKELQSLLNKHGAELEVQEDGEGYYGNHSSVTNISMGGIWNQDNDCEAEYVEFDLPTYMTPEK